MKTINELINEISTKGTILYELVMKNVNNNDEAFRGILSELYLIFVKQEDTIMRAQQEKWFNYWLIRVIKNQFRSSTSPYHKNNRETIYTKFKENIVDIDTTEVIDSQDCDLDEKIELEKDLDLIDECREELRVSFFDSELFKLYYDEQLSYRDIEREYNIDHVLAWSSVSKTRKKLIKLINEKTKNKK